MIRCGRVQQSRQHQSLGQRGGGHRAKWPATADWERRLRAFFFKDTPTAGVCLSLQHFKRWLTKSKETTTKAFRARMRGSVIFNYIRLPGADEKKRGSVEDIGGWGGGGGGQCDLTEHPIRDIQWIRVFCLQTLYILAHRRGLTARSSVLQFRK